MFQGSLNRALDKRGCLMIIKGHFFLFLIETIPFAPHLNRLDETDQMECHNIYFLQNYQKLSLIIIKYSHLSRAL